MLFWISAAALAALVALPLGVTLWTARGRGAAGGATGRATSSAAEVSSDPAAYDMQVYRDQLAEVARDAARGVIDGAEANRLRLEISRRVLETDRKIQTAGAATPLPAAARWGGIAVGVVLLAGSVGLYVWLGAPGYDDQPMQGRLALADEIYNSRPDQTTAEAEAARNRPALPAADPKYLELMEKLRAAVAGHPGDPEGLKLLAHNEAALGNYRAAWEAQRDLVAAKAATPEGARAQDYADQADLMILASGGLVTPEAEQVLGEALARDRANGTARYYVGLMMAQNGRPDRAFTLWNALLKEGPADAPWIGPIRAGIEDLAWLAGDANFELQPLGAPAADLPGPSSEDVNNAAAMSAEDRQAMIRSMVEGLSDRLATSGGSPEEWARLIGALGVLGETERARAIYAEAQGSFAGQDEALAALKAAAEQAGVAE
ncbi:c-type cytochrome biogenesis protein CcmI [Phaeovulum sp. W22_SRMD_FR3]|uniref:c-type cytochrome biogenesis protein CcmI n=1 Tax=Phaeovulum sp. W22_SRMD_FR3 TaxID=3240274 RepID=UPI003F9554C9